MTYFNALYLNDKYDNGNFHGEYWCVNSTFYSQTILQSFHIRFVSDRVGPVIFMGFIVVQLIFKLKLPKDIHVYY